MLIINAIRNPKSAIRNPQSAIRNPKSQIPNPHSKMSIEIAKIPLPRVHRIVTQERADFMSHRIPGLSGNIVQDMGRQSVRLQIDGIFYGKKAKDDLDALRKVFKDRKPVDFLADLVGQAYFSQVVIEQLEVRQAATEPDQFSYQLTVVEYVPPPKAQAQANKISMDDKLALKSKNFMKGIQIPDLLDTPNFGDPTLPLNGIKTSVDKTLKKVIKPADDLTNLFEGKNGVLTNVKTKDTNVTAAAQQATDKLIKPFETSSKTAEQETQKKVQNQLGSIETKVSTVEIPKTECATVVTERFSDVESQLNTKTQTLISDSTKDFNKMFDNLESKELSQLIQTFDKLKTLNPSPSPTTANLVAPRVLNVPDAVQIQVFKTQNSPNWELQQLLEWWQIPLNQIPREAIPLQNVPVLDELRDKIQTLLGWFQKDGNALSETFTKSILDLTQYIHSAFYEKTLTPIYIGLQKVVEPSKEIDLKKPLQNIPALLEKLATCVTSGDLTTANTTISELRTQIETVSTANQKITTIWFSAEARTHRSKLLYLNESLELEMGRVLMLAAPPKPFSIIRLGFAPMQLLLNQHGIDTFFNGVNKVLTQADDFIKSLQMKPTIDFINDTTSTVDKAIQTLQDTLKLIFEKIQKTLTTIQNAVEQFKLAELKTNLKKILEDFVKGLLNQFGELLRPVTDLILNALNTIKTFDAKPIVDQVTRLIQEVTGVLEAPAIKTVLTETKKVLTTINDEINRFAIRPVTSPVIKSIEVVQTGFEIIAVMPLPDSTRKKINEKLNKLPNQVTFRAKVGNLNDGFKTIIADNAKPKLEAVHHKLIELESYVDKYAPDHFIKDEWFKPYDKIVSVFEGLKPSTLMKPVDKSFTLLQENLAKKLQTVKIFEPLQPTLATFIEKLNLLNFNELAKPIQKSITDNATKWTQKLPLEQVDKIMNQLDLVTNRIIQGVEVSEMVRMQLLNLNDLLLRFKNPTQQVQTFSQQVMSKLDECTAFEPIFGALNQLHDAIDKTTEAHLSKSILPMLENAIAEVQKYAIQTELEALSNAQKAFPIEKLNQLPDSKEKTALQNVLKDLTTLSTPSNDLKRLLTDLTESKKNLEATFKNWQNLYHSEESPLKRFKQNSNLTDVQRKEALRKSLQTTVEEEMNAILRPILTWGDQLQPLVGTHLKNITSVMESLDKQLLDLLSVEQGLSKAFHSVKDFIFQISNIDITFLPKGLDALLVAIKQQLKDFNLKEMDDFLKLCLTDTVQQLRPEAVFAILFPADANDSNVGLAKLDGAHTHTMTQLNALHPKKLLKEPIQKEFDKLKKAVVIFDVKDNVKVFMDATDRLQQELKTELDKTADAYQALMESVPKDFQAAIGQNT
jgi:DNA circularisation protein N-terminus